MICSSCFHGLWGPLIPFRMQERKERRNGRKREEKAGKEDKGKHDR